MKDVLVVEGSVIEDSGAGSTTLQPMTLACPAGGDIAQAACWVAASACSAYAAWAVGASLEGAWAAASMSGLLLRQGAGTLAAASTATAGTGAVGACAAASVSPAAFTSSTARTALSGEELCSAPEGARATPVATALPSSCILAPSACAESCLSPAQASTPGGSPEALTCGAACCACWAGTPGSPVSE